MSWVTLADQYVASPEDHRGGLFGLTLHGHEAHGRTLRGLTDRFGIGRIVLLPLDEGLHVGRRDQLHCVAELADLPAPVMRAGTGLHSDDARGLSGEEGQHLFAPQLPAEDRRTGGIRAVRLEDVLGQIQADGADGVHLCHGRLPLVALNATILARRCRRGASTPSLQAGLDEVARFLERADLPSRQDATPVRRALAGITWHLRTGGGWRVLPAGFPPWRTVYGWFRRWIEKGLFEILMRALARRQRRCCGRRSEPRLAAIDTQSIKCIGVRGPRGYGGAKKLVGRKRVALVDAEKHVLVLAVVPANVQDRDTLLSLHDGKEQWPSLRLAILDGAFTGELLEVVQPPRHASPHRLKGSTLEPFPLT